MALSALIYVILRAPPCDLRSNLKFLELYVPRGEDGSLNEQGEGAYVQMQFSLALSFIEDTLVGMDPNAKPGETASAADTTGAQGELQSLSSKQAAPKNRRGSSAAPHKLLVTEDGLATARDTMITFRVKAANNRISQLLNPLMARACGLIICFLLQHEQARFSLCSKAWYAYFKQRFQYLPPPKILISNPVPKQKAGISKLSSLGLLDVLDSDALSPVTSPVALTVATDSSPPLSSSGASTRPRPPGDPPGVQAAQSLGFTLVSAKRPSRDSSALTSSKSERNSTPTGELAAAPPKKPGLFSRIFSTQPKA